MITYLRKGKLRYKNGRMDIKAERVVWSGGKGNGLNVHSHILKELKKDGWEEVEND